MEFNCREVVYSKFTYSKSDFINLDMFSEVQNWKEELESNSVARPVLLGSPFDDDDGNMDLNIELEEVLDPDLFYVVLYYFYEDANYAVSDEVCEGWSVNCDSVLAELDVACAMESATDGENTEYFECISSTDKSETNIIIFHNGEAVLQGNADELFADSFVVNESRRIEMSIDQLVENCGKSCFENPKLIKQIQSHLESGKLKGGSWKFSSGEDYWEIIITLDVASRKEAELSEDEEDWVSEFIDPRDHMEHNPMNWNNQLSEKNKDLSIDNYNGPVFLLNCI